MADPFSNWLPPHSPLTANADGQEELFMHNNRAYAPRLSFFQNELNNVNQLAKLYQNIPVYGNGPLTDDEKSEIARRNESGFVIVPPEDNGDGDVDGDGDNQ
ncbi:hypothetical protein KR222_008487, partial [Zaprionus bogoriensis]